MFANDVALLFSMTDEEELFVQFSSESISFLLFLFICTGWIVVYRYTFNYLICSEGLSIKFVAWTGSNFENFTSNWTSNSNLKLSFMVIISQKKEQKQWWYISLKYYPLEIYVHWLTAEHMKDVCVCPWLQKRITVG